MYIKDDSFHLFGNNRLLIILLLARVHGFILVDLCHSPAVILFSTLDLCFNIFTVSLYQSSETLVLLMSLPSL